MRKKSWNLTVGDFLLQEFIDNMSENALDTDNDDEIEQVTNLANIIYNDGFADAEDNSTALIN